MCRYDAAFVAEVAALYPTLPMYANLRCGLWYAPSWDGMCYFKSTDGHVNQWTLSLRRHVQDPFSRLASPRCSKPIATLFTVFVLLPHDIGLYHFDLSPLLAV
jgi:hypothetical protein